MFPFKAFFCVITASTALGNASPSLQVISQARGAAYFIWELIDRVKNVFVCCLQKSVNCEKDCA